MSAEQEAIKGYQQQRKQVIHAICNTNTAYTHYRKRIETLNARLSEIDEKIMIILGLEEAPKDKQMPDTPYLNVEKYDED